MVRRQEHGRYWLLLGALQVLRALPVRASVACVRPLPPTWPADSHEGPVRRGLAQAYDCADQPDEAISALGERTLLPRSVPRVLVLSSLHALRWHAARSQAPWTRLEVLGPPKQRAMCQLRPRFCLPLAAVIPVHPQSGLSHCLTRAAHFC